MRNLRNNVLSPAQNIIHGNIFKEIMRYTFFLSNFTKITILEDELNIIMNHFEGTIDNA